MNMVKALKMALVLWTQREGVALFSSCSSSIYISSLILGNGAFPGAEHELK